MLDGIVFDGAVDVAEEFLDEAVLFDRCGVVGVGELEDGSADGVTG